MVGGLEFYTGDEMSDLATSKAIRSAAQSLSIAFFCAAITASILLPVVSVVVFRTAIKWQAESMQQQIQQRR
jgi:hypothetical protein